MAAHNGDDTREKLEGDKVGLLQAKVAEAKRGMEQNVDAILENAVKVDNVARAAQELAVRANGFRLGSRELRRKLWWRQMRMRLAVAAFVLLLAAAVAGAITAAVICVK